jgi:hypothetical protein
MSVRLHDFFAAHVAAALVSRGSSAAEAAKQAYDVADALMEERRFRSDAEWLASPPASEAEPTALDPQMLEADRFDRPHLLDEPMPPMDDEDIDEGDVFDPSWEDRAIDPSWEREPRWAPAPPSSPRPGLKRTQPQQTELPLQIEPARGPKRTQSA